MINERVAALEAIVIGKTGKDGVIARLDHLHQCVESVKRALWIATGAIIAAQFFFQWVFR